MDRSLLLPLAALAAVLACVLTGKLEAEAFVTFLVGLGLKSPLPQSS